MMEQTKTTEQLNKEISMLRRENKALSAQLAYHKRLFREVNLALGADGDFATARMIPEEIVLRPLGDTLTLANGRLKILNLTEREKEVLRHIVHGQTSKEIADNLGISKLTVDTHRKHIQQKLGVSKQVDLLKLAMQSGIA
jgi:DNA-binding CsgD family transcriptional regulator